VRLCFVIAALWWCGFGLTAIRRLNPAQRFPTGLAPGDAVPARGGWSVVWRDLRQLRTRPQTRRYLIAYLFISDATSAVIALSSTFLTHQLFDDNTDRAATFLFALILLIQFLAIAGAALGGKAAAAVGAKRVVAGSLIGWCAVMAYAFAAIDSKATAVAAGIAIGLILGATTALTRSLFAQMVPPGREATYFSIYETSNQGTAWMGPLLFTLVVTVTGSFRQAILSLILLFGLGLAVLIATDCDAARVEATLPSARPTAGSPDNTTE
jgi:MFS transporter, UMF1 family